MFSCYKVSKKIRPMTETTSDNRQMERSTMMEDTGETSRGKKRKPESDIPASHGRSNSISTSIVNEASRETLMKEIQKIMLSVVRAVGENKFPTLKLESRITWKDCSFSDRLGIGDRKGKHYKELSFSDRSKREEFSLLMHLLSKTFRLITTRSSSTRRELYYQDVELFESQRKLDDYMDKVCSLLNNVGQWELGVFQTSKGLIVGDITLTITHNSQNDTQQTTIIDCSNPPGVLISAELVHGNVVLETRGARSVLVIEKDAAYQKLIAEGFLDRFGPCIMITGKGYPDVNTRLLVHNISEQLKLPVYILVDSDPFGIEIMCVYRFGSLKLAHLCNKLAVPSIRWLGLHPTDIVDLGLPSMDMMENDMQRAHALLQRPFIRNNQLLVKQIRTLIETKKKSEIEDLAKLSSGYLTDVYIQMKIASSQQI